MDDLISRAAVLEALGEPHPMDYNACSVVRIVKDTPSVSAVPLDKLCEWLASFRAELPVAVACNYRGAKVCTDCDYMDRSLVDCWKRILTRWMEGLDGTD